jgi:hypothetical protein
MPPRPNPLHDEIVRLYREGLGPSAIAHRFGMHRSSIGRIVTGAKASRKPLSWQDPTIVARCQALRAQGMSWRQIGQVLGITRKQASGIFHKRSVKRGDGPTLTEEDMLARIAADGQFPVCREVELRGNRFGVLLERGDELIPVVSTGLILKVAA